MDEIVVSCQNSVGSPFVFVELNMIRRTPVPMETVQIYTENKGLDDAG